MMFPQLSLLSRLLTLSLIMIRGTYQGGNGVLGVGQTIRGIASPVADECVSIVGQVSAMITHMPADESIKGKFIRPTMWNPSWNSSVHLGADEDPHRHPHKSRPSSLT